MVAFPSPGAMRPTARDNAKAALRISEGFNMESKHNRLIGYLVYDAQKHITKSLEVTLKPYDITPGQWNLINQLDQAGELSGCVVARDVQRFGLNLFGGCGAECLERLFTPSCCAYAPSFADAQFRHFEPYA